MMEKENILEAQKSLLSSEEEEEDYIQSWQRSNRKSNNGLHLTRFNIVLIATNLLGLLGNLILPSVWRSSAAIYEPERDLIYCVSPNPFQKKMKYQNVRLTTTS